MTDLGDLGLSEYEAQVYRALLRTGTATAKELSDVSGVPMGRVYDVLADLEGRSLVRSQTASRPKKYIAVEPDTALDRLVDDRRREMEQEVERYERIADELKEGLDAPGDPGERFWTAAVGVEQSMDLLLERVEAAEDRIVMGAGDIPPQLDLDRIGDRVLDAVAAALDDGVEIRMLLSTDLLWQFGEDVQERFTDRFMDAEGVELRAAEGDVHGTFDLIDDSEVCIAVPNPLDRTEPLAMIDLKDPTFAAEMQDRFRARWEEATPVQPAE